MGPPPATQIFTFEQRFNANVCAELAQQLNRETPSIIERETEKVSEHPHVWRPVWRIPG